jgi:hypothetical protein
MPLRIRLRLQQLQQPRNRSVVIPFAHMTVADKYCYTQGESCALRACPQTNGVDVLAALLLFINFA